MVSLPITIPHGFEVQVAVGDDVKVGSLLAKQTAPSGSTISITKALNVTARQAAKFLKVKPGDKVVQGDILAEKKSLLSQEKVFSEVTGEITGYERDSGELIIKREGVDEKSKEIVSPIVGQVKVCNNDQIVIETDKDILLGTDGVGESSEGEIVSIKKQNGESGSSILFALDGTIISKILLVTESDRDILLKAIGMGVLGVITGSVSETDLSYLTKRNIATPVILVDQDTLKKVTTWNGKHVHLNGQGKTIVLLHL